MPRRPCRFEDFGRTKRYQILRGRLGPDNGDDGSSSSAASSDREVQGSVFHNSDANRESVLDSDDLEDMGVLEHQEETRSDIQNVDDNSAAASEDHDEDNINDEDDHNDVVDAASEVSGVESDHDNEELQSEHGDGEEGNANDHVPLYPGAPVTVGESMHLTLTFALNHNLSGQCIGDLLELISLHCAQPNRCLTSLYHFKNFFKNVNIPMRRHYYCSKCSSFVDGDNCNVCEATEKSYFITMSIVPQLRVMFGRDGFHGRLRHRFHRIKKHASNYEDIYDGHIYQSQCREDGFLSDPNAISFCWNTDGVPVFKSSNYSIWPFFLCINELPYEDRVRKENIILAGLWFGSKKPVVNMFLHPLLPELQLLSNGVAISIPPQNINVNIKARILNGTCDMPAKAHFLNLVSYNGYYGCTACKQRGERTPTNRHVYRYDNNFVMRSDAENEDFARMAVELGGPYFGVKSLSIISRITDYPITGTAIDPMHKYSGIVMKLMAIWFSPEFHNHPASISQMVRLVDQRLCSIKPPIFVQRLPRSLTHLKYFKVSELKVFLFCYAIPILHDLLPADYFNHFKLLVHGLFLLNQTSISPGMIHLASSLLDEFVLQFEDWYGLEHMSCNIHQLLHLSTFTENLGPLFASSCAPFENMNGVLKKFVHGTRYADLQVCTAASLYMSLSIFNERHLRREGPVQEFSERLSKRRKRLHLVPVTEMVSAVDKVEQFQIVPALIRNALLDVAAPTGKVYTFKKAFYRKQLFLAESYVRAKKTHSSCIKFRDGDQEKIGSVRNFLKVTACECRFVCQCPASCFAIVNVYETRNPFSTRGPQSVLSFVHECTLTNNHVAVRVENFITLCFHIPVADVEKLYVVEPVNNVELHD